MKLTIEQEFEKENLKRYLEKNPEQAAKIVWELLEKITQKRQEQKKNLNLNTMNYSQDISISTMLISPTCN